MLSKRLSSWLIKLILMGLHKVVLLAFGIWFAFDFVTGRSRWSIPELIVVVILILGQSYAVFYIANWGAKVWLYAFRSKNWRPHIIDFIMMIPVCLRTLRFILPFIIVAPFLLGVYFLQYRWTGFQVGIACYLLAVIMGALFELWPPYAVVLGRSSDEATDLFFAVHSGLYPVKIVACLDSSGNTPVVLLRYEYRTLGSKWKKQVDALLSICWVAILDARRGSDSLSYEITSLKSKRCCKIIVTKDDGTCPALCMADELRLRADGVEFTTVSNLISQFS